MCNSKRHLLIARGVYQWCGGNLSKPNKLIHRTTRCEAINNILHHAHMHRLQTVFAINVAGDHHVGRFEMKINDIADSILSGIDNLESHTPFSDRFNSEYLRKRKEIVLEHLRTISQPAVQADAKCSCFKTFCKKYPAIDGKCPACGNTRTA